jgi:hypothetical protein
MTTRFEDVEKSRRPQLQSHVKMPERVSVEQVVMWGLSRAGGAYFRFPFLGKGGPNRRGDSICNLRGIAHTA